MLVSSNLVEVTDRLPHLEELRDEILSWVRLPSTPLTTTKTREDEKDRSHLIRLFKMDHDLALPRALVLSMSGITEVEARQNPLHGPLDDLSAANILNGPFGIALTQVPHHHLTFKKRNGKSTLQVLELQFIFRVYSVQRAGIARFETVKMG
jgi:hypothetical protein